MAEIGGKLGNLPFNAKISGLDSGGGSEGLSMKDLLKDVDLAEPKLALKSFSNNIKEGGGKAVKAIGGAISAIATGGINMAKTMAECNAEIKKAEIALEQATNTFRNQIQKINLETAFKNQLAYMDTYMKNTENLTRAAFKTLGEGITSGAWGSYNAMIEAATAEQKLGLEMQYNETKKYIEQSKLQNSYKLELTQKENAIQLAENKKSQAIANTITGAGSAVGNALTELGGPTGIVGQVVSVGSDVAKASTDLYYTQQRISMELSEATLGKDVKNIGEQFENLSVIIDNEYQMKVKSLEFELAMQKVYAEQAQTVEKFVKDFNELATKAVSLYGYVGNQLEALKAKDLANGITAWATRYHMKPEDMISAQLGYQTSTGRNLHLSEMDVAMTSFLDKYAGENGITGKIASELQVFNKSVSDSGEMVAKRMASLERAGLSSKKYAKDVEKYIGLANKYNFRGGTEGLAKMLEYAQKTRFNMDSIGGALDKFSTTDISSVLESSARLNVLGGNAALYGDAIGMRYEAINDPDAFMRRMQAMVGGYGSFNRTTGEMTYDEVGTMIMKTMSEVIGISVEDMRKMNSEAEKRRQITSQMGGGLTNDNLDFLIANSFWDKKTGGWATNIGGKTTSIAGLENKDINKIIPQTTEDKMSQITQSVESIRTNIDQFLGKGSEEQMKDRENQLMVAKEFYAGMMEEFNKRIGESGETVMGTLIANKNKIMEASQAATTAMADVNAAAKAAMAKLTQGKQPIDVIQEDVHALKVKFVGEAAKTETEQSYKNIFDAEWRERGKTAVRELGLEGLTDDDIDTLNHAFREAKKRGGRPQDLQRNDIGRGGKVYHYNAGKVEEVDLYEMVMKKYNDLMRPKNSDLIVKSLTPAVNKYFENQKVATKAKDAFTQGSMYSRAANLVTSPNDVNMSWQKGGPLDTLFNGVAEKVNVIGDFVSRATGGASSSGGARSVDVNVNFGGRAELSCNGNRIDLGEVLMNDPFFTRKLTEEILREISKMFDGRGVWNSYVNLKNIFK